MGKLSTLRNAIKETLKAKLPEKFDIDTHSGRFDGNALQQFIAKSPAIRIAILALPKFTPFGENADKATCQIGIYISLKDDAERLDRDVNALDFVEDVLLSCNTNRWGLPFAFGAIPQGAQNLHSDFLAGKGVALWAIDISQDIIIEPDDAPGPNELSGVFLGVAPQIGIAHKDDYTKIDADTLSPASLQSEGNNG